MSGPETADGGAPDLRATGARIEALLDASAAGGAVARERAEELVRLTADLYGAGLERVLDIVHERGRLDAATLDALADDDLVASLLLVHGLHPHDVSTRVGRALDRVRPYLGSHGGDVELIEVTAQGVVRLALLGSCDGCPSSAVTLQLAVKDAVEAAAPEVTGIEVEAPAHDPAPAPSQEPVIPVAALRVRLDAPAVSPGTGWEPVPELAGLGSGELCGVDVAGIAVVVARAGSVYYAYRDSCPHCSAALSGARLERRLGGAADDAVLRCPACRSHFDVRHAGAGLDGPGADGEVEHLDPVPLLVRDGVVRLAVPRAVGT